MTFRPPGVTAKAAATLDVLSGGRAFVGVGAGWWEREHARLRAPLPGDAATGSTRLEAAIETMRALWAPGTKAYDGERVPLPETTSYPRPVSTIPIIVGGGGERRTLRIAARLADGCNVRLDPDTIEHKIEVLHGHCRAAGRDPTEVAVTVLDLPVVGQDRDDVWARVERLRGRTAAATYAAGTTPARPTSTGSATPDCADIGVSTVFVGLPDLERAGGRPGRGRRRATVISTASISG